MQSPDITRRKSAKATTPFAALLKPCLAAMLATPLMSGVALAQETAAVDTLREAVGRAVVKNPSVQASWHAFQASRDEVDVAFGGYLPSVDVTAGVGREWREDDGRGGYSADFAELTLTQMLWDGLETANEVERLNHAKLVSYYELMEASNNVALEVTQAYQDVKRYRELVRLAQANYAEHLEVYRQIERRVESGAGRGVDLEQITGRLALAESNLLTEAANLHDVSARYLRLVGVLPADELAPVPSMDARLPPSVSKAVNLAYEGNPGFHAAIENINAARAEAQGTKSAFHPQVAFRASTGSNNESGVEGRYDRSTVQIVASMNLYRGGSDLASLRSAQDRIEQAIALREQECVNLRQTTMIAYNDTRRIAEQLKYLNQHRLSIGRVRGAYQQQFNIGQRSLLDVLDSENEYFEASRAYVNAQYDLEMAHARTLAAMGQLLPALEVSREGVPTLAELGSNGVTINGETICPAPAPTHYSLEELTAGLLPVSLAEPTQPPDVTMDSDTLFEINSAELSGEARQALSALAAEIRAMDDLQRIFIAGHADSTGTDAINDPLSRARARSVAAYLDQAGVDPTLMVLNGYGSRRPVASNETAAGRRANRRVEVTLERLGE